MSRARDIANFGDGIATADIDDGAVTAAKLFSGFANGVTEADMWRLAADKTGVDDNSNVIDANLERVDDSYFNYIGTGMSQSSGVFTFPSTGIWLVKINYSFVSTGTSSRHIGCGIGLTTNNGSNWTSTDPVDNNSRFLSHVASNTYSGGTNEYMFDVANTSTHKVRFNARSNATLTLRGNTSRNSTFMTFVRLGDT